MSKILVTGANGQLGQALQKAAVNHAGLQFFFAGSAECDITNPEQLETLFAGFKPDYCINAAAYTAVDKAENEPEKSYAINVQGAANLAGVCHSHNTVLLHISTDFVFDGTKTTPYTETDATAPLGVYGETKLQGEEAVKQGTDKYFIIRTSWVYSEFGNNFMKTMLRLGAERSELKVVDDQKGTPTNANDLAEALITIIKNGSVAYGIYNFSNEGETTWYGFAKKIFDLNNISINLLPIPTEAYPTPAKRPAYSVLDKSAIKGLGIIVKPWEESLQKYNQSE